ncbi:MAG TPA: hypothetical protein VF165_04160 [Nocardioidaceae bacterium]
MSEQSAGRRMSALTPPPLDDVRYADLVADAVARIPVHTPAWTDHNASDPGITVLEAFAYVVDGLGWTLSRYDRRAAASYAVLLGEEPTADPEVDGLGSAGDAALARAVRRLGAVARAVTGRDVASVVRGGVVVLDLPLTVPLPGGTAISVRKPDAVVGALARAAKAGETTLFVATQSVRAGDRLVVGQAGAGAEVVTVEGVSPEPGSMPSQTQSEIALTAGLAVRRTRGAPVSLLGPVLARTTTLVGVGTGAGSFPVDPTELPDSFVVDLPDGGGATASRVARATLLGPREVVVVGPDGAQADEELCETAFQLLRRRSPAASRVTVSVPRHSAIDVEAWVVREPFGLQRTDALRAAATAALARYLDSVHGGPDGDGWPVGGPVYRSALFDVLERVPGVDHVHRLAVDGDADSDAWPLAVSAETASRSVAAPGRLEVTVLDAADGW